MAPSNDSAHQYKAIDQVENAAFGEFEESSESLNGVTKGTKNFVRYSGRYSSVLTILNCTIFSCSVLLFALSYHSPQRNLASHHSSYSALKETSFYSPMFERIHIPLITTRINGSLLNNHHHTVYREEPSPLVDAAWDRVAAIGTISLSEAEVLNIGLDSSDPTLARYPTSFGLGPEAFVAELDVFHQIHCLNALRKTAFQNFDYYFGGEFPDGKPDEAHRAHVHHCVYILLQNLMCKADVDIVTHRWLDVRLHPFPDFNIQKKCRDFETILRWQEENVVEFDEMMAFRKPLEVVPVRTDSEFQRLFSQTEDI